MTVAWKPPKDDGGAPIQNYIMEKRPRIRWRTVAIRIGPYETEATANNLSKGACVQEAFNDYIHER